MGVKDKSTADPERQNPEAEEPRSLGKLDKAILERAETLGSKGLTPLQEKITEYCVGAFGDTSFTVAMFCAQTGLSAVEALDAMMGLHLIGVLRCPVNDGGQCLYQVIPGVVHPRRGGVRF